MYRPPWCTQQRKSPTMMIPPTRPCLLCDGETHHIGGTEVYLFDCPSCGRFVIDDHRVVRGIMAHPPNSPTLRKLSDYIRDDQAGELRFTMVTPEVCRDVAGGGWGKDNGADRRKRSI